MFWNLDAAREMNRLRREMDTLFSNPYGYQGATASWPLVNVYDDRDTLMVTAELPGLSRDKVTIVYADGVLTISGSTAPSPASKTMTLVRQERANGDFEKTIRIPAKVVAESISATFTDGILTVTLPKAEEAKPKTITIETK